MLVGFSTTLSVKYVLFVVAALGGGFAFERWIPANLEKWSYGLVALAAAATVYTTFPSIFVDDTGFVIRYMNQAREGCFYCYNVSDGPVYGVSSFVYGILTIGLAALQVGSNESIIISLNFAGLCVLFYFLLLILRARISSNFVVISAAALVVLASTRFLFSATAGLETNVHLAIVFTGLYFFYIDKRKWMWFFFSLSVISKLDTVPLITALSLIHLLENRTEYFGKQWLRNWKIGLLFAGVPIIAFVGITFLLFDGPLPQSAYAKLYHHSHPSDHWFPFLELMLDKGNRLALVAGSLLLALIHLVLVLSKKAFEAKDFSLLVGFICTMGLYYIYNPVERMTWYYAMPELLLYAQMAISSTVALRMLSKGDIRLLHGSYVLMFAALSIAAVPLTMGEKDWMDRYLNAVEVERLEIGRFIAEFSAGDTLVSAHGHFGANYKGYVLDLSGLNSKLVTDFERNADSLLSTFKPRYFINHASDENASIALQNGYIPIQEWTAIEQYGYPKWVLYERPK